MFTAQQECRRKKEEANRIRALLLQIILAGAFHDHGVKIV